MSFLCVLTWSLTEHYLDPTQMYVMTRVSGAADCINTYMPPPSKCKYTYIWGWIVSKVTVKPQVLQSFLPFHKQSCTGKSDRGSGRSVCVSHAATSTEQSFMYSLGGISSASRWWWKGLSGDEREREKRETDRGSDWTIVPITHVDFR